MRAGSCFARGGLALACATLLAGPGAAWAAEAAVAPVDHSVRAPHYGDVLFQYFQDQYFDAITAQMVSRHFERLSPHDDEAELLRGGMLLSYGMHEAAGALFERLVNQTASAAVRDRAWFFLAKVRYTRGLAQAAQQALNQIQAELGPELRVDAQLLRGQVHLALGDAAGAAQALQPLALRPSTSAPPRPPGSKPSWFDAVAAFFLAPFSRREPLASTDADAPLYARYNLGVALVRGGDLEGGTRWLDELGQLPAYTEEQRSLRDQANLALGFGALQRDEPELARQWLERIRLQGPSSSKALLGFGWAHLALKDPRQALVAWTELLDRDPGDAAVLEARLAVPHALAELGASAQALARYQQSLRDFRTEGEQLDQTISTLRGDDWLTQLLDLNAQTDMGWFHRVDSLPDLPHAQQLAPILASHAFQEGFKSLRDLQFLQHKLQAWQDTLGTYTDMLTQRQARFEQGLPAVREQAGRVGTQDLVGMRQRQDSLQSAFTQAEQDADGVAYADVRQRDLQQRLSRSRVTVAALLEDRSARGTATPAAQALPEPVNPGDELDLATTARRLDLAAGALRWELAQALTERQWQARKSLQTSAEGLTQAQASLDALAQAQIDETRRLGQLGQRIQALTLRVQALQAPLDTVTRDQANQLQALAVAGLQAQQQRLASYTTQARFAMAQLLDQARQPQERDDVKTR
jgi:hypothetical protein